MDNPNITTNRTKILRNKKFLRNIYIDFYTKILDGLEGNEQSCNILELGSGAGFFDEFHPNIITSEIIPSPIVDLYCNGVKAPFRNNSLSAITMINVFHHIPDAIQFLREVDRLLEVGGKLVMIEPTKTPFSLFVYKNIHHEPFETDTGWRFESTGPLSDANGALPWIVFERDRNVFTKMFPNLEINIIDKHTPFRFLLSGGLSKPQLLPNSMYKIVDMFENTISPLNHLLAMFMTVILTKNA